MNQAKVCMSWGVSVSVLFQKNITVVFFAMILVLGETTTTNAAIGDITTVAGGGFGDGNTAITVNLNEPRAVAVDAAGNLFIADQGNHLVRKVDTAWIISTVAGNGTAGFSSDGGIATNASISNLLLLTEKNRPCNCTDL